MTKAEQGKPDHSSRGVLWMAGLGPLILTALLVMVFLAVGPLSFFRDEVPPVEELAVERVILNPDEFLVYLVNDGPDPVTIAQVLVNDAFWHFEMTPDTQLAPLGRAQLRVRYPWEPGSAQFLTLLSSTGVTFEVEVPVAVETPKPDARFLSLFAMLGIYVGVIPVFLGILWLPFLKRLGPAGYQFFLALTIGLLVFLGVDSLRESWELVDVTPGVYQGAGLALIGLLGTFLILGAISQGARTASAGPGSRPGLLLAYLVAFGIGVHNLGEGLAIGGAYAAGEVTLGALLVLGFMVHNVTEGVAIIAPIAREKARFFHLCLLGLLAGAPTILGTWTGGFAFSAIWSVLFLAIGAGAVFQVVLEIVRSMSRHTSGPLLTTGNVAGFLSGLAVMYATGFLAAV